MRCATGRVAAHRARRSPGHDGIIAGLNRRPASRMPSRRARSPSTSLVSTFPLFWLLAFALVAATLALLVWPLLRRGRAEAPAEDAAATAVFRDHRRQLDDEFAAGLLITCANVMRRSPIWSRASARSSRSPPRRSRRRFGPTALHRGAGPGCAGAGHCRRPVSDPRQSGGADAAPSQQAAAR